MTSYAVYADDVKNIYIQRWSVTTDENWEIQNDIWLVTDPRCNKGALCGRRGKEEEKDCPSLPHKIRAALDPPLDMVHAQYFGKCNKLIQAYKLMSDSDSS